MKRSELVKRLKPFKHQRNIELALEGLQSVDSENVSNEEIGDTWHWVSKALDVEFSDDENHPTWQLEQELSIAYKRN
jgi:hypothetical protein